MAEFVPTMFDAERPAEDLALLVGETQKLGANAATCILLDQSLQRLPRGRRLLRAADAVRMGARREARPGREPASGWPSGSPADLHIFEHSGHCPMWEEPELFNQVVGDWISGLVP